MEFDSAPSGMVMGAHLDNKTRVFLFGAAALSLLFPRRRAAPHPPGPAELRAPVRPPRAEPPRRMWALVQVRPDVRVLAVSASRAELERELAEINATWNHCELRDERQRYAIQPAPVLYPAPRDPGPPVAQAGRERTEG
jgi:hypothetical protein